MDTPIEVIRVDPMGKVGGLVFPYLIQRVHDFIVEEAVVEADPVIFTRQVAARVWANDDTLLLLAALTPDGELVGHALCEMRDGGGRKFLYVLQCKVDRPQTDTIKKMIQLGEAYARARGGTCIKMETTRTDKAWTQEYGFKTFMHLMVRKFEGVE